MREVDDGLVSVIVPTYNRAFCISRAIDSVGAQTWSNWEVVIVDDGSTDDTARLIASSYGHDPRIRYVYQKNAGVSAARNAGIRESRGDYVAFLDSDDVWKPWKLEVQLACFKYFPEVGMVWTNFEAMDTAGIVVNRHYLTKMYTTHERFGSFEKLFKGSELLSKVVAIPDGEDADTRIYRGNIYTEMLRGNLVHTSTVILSRARMEKVKGFNEEFALSGEDYDFHFRTCKWGEVCLIDIPSVIYQLGFEDRLTRFVGEIAKNFLTTVEGAIEREKGSGIFPKAMVGEVLAEGNAWVAEEYLKTKDYRRVRYHALRGLQHDPLQPRLAFHLFIATLPRFISEPFLGGYRRLKSLLRARKEE
jgi:glycosyltransferase involved in cell wall biosynthesis